MTIPKSTRLALLAASLSIVPAFSEAAQFGDFMYSDDGASITITGNTLTVPEHIAIPATIDGKPVRTIGAEALSNSNISGVSIPQGVTHIGERAFSGCPNLYTVKFPASLRYIGEKAFEGKGGLCSVIFTGSAPSIGKNPFKFAAPGFKIFVEKGVDGFTVPKWNGHKVSTPAPEIVIFDPKVYSNSRLKPPHLVSEVSEIVFEETMVGVKSEWRTFMLRNVGSRKLSRLKLKINGRNSDDFIVQWFPKDELKPGGESVFKIRFKPLAHLRRTAQLRISSNDADESPFIIQLRGRGLKPLE